MNMIITSGKFGVKVIKKLCQRVLDGKVSFILFIFLFSCIFIFLSLESDQCAIRARLGVASHLSTTPRWGNPAKCHSQRHN